MKKEYKFSKGKRGAVVPAPKGKTRITIRIDDDILDWFRGEVDAAGGGNYQTLINQALREYLNQQQQPLRNYCGGSYVKNCIVSHSKQGREILEISRESQLR